MNRKLASFIALSFAVVVGGAPAAAAAAGAPSADPPAAAPKKAAKTKAPKKTAPRAKSAPEQRALFAGDSGTGKPVAAPAESAPAAPGAR